MKKNYSQLYLYFILTLIYLPIIIVIVYSFNESKMATIWSGFSFKWYKKLFSNNILMEALKTSLILGGISCAVSAVVGTMGAVALWKSSSFLKNIEKIVFLPLMIPEIILGMAFLAFFTLFKIKLGMTTLIIAHCSFCIPYIFLMVKSALSGMDSSLSDAARDLGAGKIKAFFTIEFPLILPSVLSGMFLAFAMSMDDVVISFFVAGATTNTLPVKIYSQLKMGVTPEINALCTIMLVITSLIICLSLFVRRKK